MPCVQRLGENARKAKAAPSKHRTDVNSVAFLCVAKCGVKGLALMNGTAKLCRNKGTELFLYCIYPCYYSCAVRRMSYKMGSVSSFWCHICAWKFMLAYIYHAIFRVGGG